MSCQQPIELFMPPNMLKAKAGGGSGGTDMGAIKRAESAMESIKGQFKGMAADDVKALTTARERYAANPGPDTRAGLARAAHDLKGQATTFGFPLIARVASSLGKLMNEAPAGHALSLPLVDAHVSAIQVIHRQNLTGAEDQMVLMLLSELDRQVGENLARAAR